MTRVDRDLADVQARLEELQMRVARGDRAAEDERDQIRDRRACLLAVAQDGFGRSSAALAPEVGLTERQVRAEIRVGRGILRRRSLTERSAAA